MNNIKEKKTLEIIVKGYLWVNLPVTVIILVLWYSLSRFLYLGNLFSILIGTALGWFYWEFSIKKWIEWALNNEVNKDRLLRIGKLSLLLSNGKYIDKTIAEKNKT